jgi:hypothetical protein
MTHEFVCLAPFCWCVCEMIHNRAQSACAGSTSMQCPRFGTSTWLRCAALESPEESPLKCPLPIGEVPVFGIVLNVHADHVELGG